MTWTLNVSGHFDPDDENTKEGFIEDVREMLRSLPHRVSYAFINWSLSDDQEQINVTPEPDPEVRAEDQPGL